MHRSGLIAVTPSETLLVKHSPRAAGQRITSIDLLRGTVMIIMALDHVRDYFHRDAFHYSPTDLSQTSAVLFFTRFATHFCAPVFVFLAGISAFLYGTKKTKKELSYFLLTRGIWLVLVELFIVSLFRTFNPLYNYNNLQVIWAIGICMIALSGMVYLNKYLLLIIAGVLVAGHNLLDNIHVQGDGPLALVWAFLHETKLFQFGHYYVFVHYPVLSWLGILGLGYCCGSLYAAGYNPAQRRQLLLLMGIFAIALFIALRSGNWYGDAALWSPQKNAMFSFMSFINVTKYPPSLLYTLITLGPALIFLSVSERPLTALTTRITIFGRVAMFYYLAHILLIHIFAIIAALVTGGHWQRIAVLTTPLTKTPALKDYGYGLPTVYMVWIGLVFILYPFCKRFDTYKRTHLSSKPWLSYF